MQTEPHLPTTLRPQEVTMLRLALKADTVSHRDLFAAFYGTRCPDDVQRRKQVIKAVACKLRRKLEPVGGVVILHRDTGLTIPPDAKQRIREALAARRFRRHEADSL